jgi:ketosteroid isomerase-like protein
MTNVAFIQRILDDAFATLDFRVLAAHLAEDVVFEVTPPGEADVIEGRGRNAVVDYFTSLGDIVSFWRVRCYGDGERVVGVGAERFTIPRGVTLGGEFALLLHVCGDRITRFFIIEDLSRAPELEVAAFQGGSV